MTINILAASLLEAKAAENTARAHRIFIEGELVDAIGVKDEGTTTETSDLFKITTTGKLTRTLNTEKLIEIKGKIPQPIMNRLVTIQPKLNLRELRYIESNEPEIYNIFSRALTIKPAKPTVTIKEI